MFKLCFFVPVSHVEQVKQAVFAAGAGRLGDYDCCSWQVLGTGQFRPLDGSQPFIGQAGVVEQVEEYRVEMLCAADCIEAAVTALRQAHPYEEPAFDVWRLESALMQPPFRG
ncbi:YqfO family protein [Halopseudomonas sp.]|uniref:YqfO family protein n=1 Tax=Halopseudomonas sp. TaxID=2901191 RepID=UPI00311E88BC